MGSEPFTNRRDAGKALATRLAQYRGPGTLVLGLPRGGVAVAAEVAGRLGAELDVVVARKLGSPISPELAVGAVTSDGERVLDDRLIRSLRVSDRYLEAVTTRECAEARRRELRFRGTLPPPRIAGRTVLVVDDGLATGATMRAALRAVRQRQPARLVAAVPVGPADTCQALLADADEVVCLETPEDFAAVGNYYRDFRQVEDDEVVRLLAARP